MTDKRLSEVPQFIRDKRDSIVSLCRQHHVVRLELFGSAATGRFDPDRSDLDFLVEFDMSADVASWLDNYFDFRQALADLFGRSVDFVALRAVRNAYVRARIESQRLPVYAA